MKIFSANSKEIQINMPVYQMGADKNGNYELIRFYVVDIALDQYDEIRKRAILALTRTEKSESDIKQQRSETKQDWSDNVSTDPYYLIERYENFLQKRLEEMTKRIPEQIEELSQMREAVKNNQYFKDIEISTEDVEI